LHFQEVDLEKLKFFEVPFIDAFCALFSTMVECYDSSHAHGT